MMLRQTYDDVGFPCRKRASGPPDPVSMSAMLEPSTLSSRYVFAGLTVFVPVVAYSVLLFDPSNGNIFIGAPLVACELLRVPVERIRFDFIKDPMDKLSR